MPNHVLCKLFICGLTYVAASGQGVQERVEANKQGWWSRKPKVISECSSRAL